MNELMEKVRQIATNENVSEERVLNLALAVFGYLYDEEIRGSQILVIEPNEEITSLLLFKELDEQLND